MDNNEKKGSEKTKKINLNTKLIVILLIVIAFLSFIVYLLVNNSGDNGIIIRAKSSFKKAIDIDELRTATFTYNGVAKKCKEECKNDGNDEYVYYVMYEGDVTAGIDFDEIDFKIDKANKKMIIAMPQVKITNSHTYIEKQRFIFKNSSYDNVTELSEANRICNEDIKKKASEDNLLIDTAKENARIVLRQFFETWLNNYYPGYSLEVM